MKIILLKCIMLITACVVLMACGQAGKLYLPTQENPNPLQNTMSKA